MWSRMFKMVKNSGELHNWKNGRERALKPNMSNFRCEGQLHMVYSSHSFQFLSYTMTHLTIIFGNIFRSTIWKYFYTLLRVKYSSKLLTKWYHMSTWYMYSYIGMSCQINLQEIFQSMRWFLSTIPCLIAKTVHHKNEGSEKLPD